MHARFVYDWRLNYVHNEMNFGAQFRARSLCFTEMLL